jgi:hypothetical protein
MADGGGCGGVEVRAWWLQPREIEGEEVVVESTRERGCREPTRTDESEDKVKERWYVVLGERRKGNKKEKNKKDAVLRNSEYYTVVQLSILIYLLYHYSYCRYSTSLYKEAYYSISNA